MKLAVCTFCILLGLVRGYGQTLTGPNLSLTNQAGWDSVLSYTYFSAGAARIRIGAGTNTVTSSIPVTNQAGTYRFWIVGVTPSSTGGVRVQLGDAEGHTALPSFTWVKSDPLVVSTAFTNLSITLTNNNWPATQDYHIGVVNVASTNEAPVASAVIANTGNLFIDYRIPVTTNSTTLSGNLIPNASFELGMDGWMFSRQSLSNRIQWREEAIDTAQYHSGSNSVKLTVSKARYSITSPVFRLRGTNVWRPYTVSFWAKGSGNVTLTASLAPVIPPVSGFPYTNSFTFNCGNPGGTWTRFSTNVYLCPVPSPEFFLSIQHVGTADDNYVWIDDVQVEEGSTASDFSQSSTLEHRLYFGRNGNVFYANDSVNAYVEVFNAGSTVPCSVLVETYGVENSLVQSRTVSFTAAAGWNSVAVSVPNSVGAYRCVSRLLAASGYTLKETGYVILPIANPSTVLVTNSVIGTHANPVSGPISSNKAWGISWSRTLSPAGTFNWKTIEPTEGVYSWDYSDWAVNQSSNSITLGSFGDVYSGGSATPSWAITNGMPQLSQLSNWCYQVVNRYKDRVRYWETINEPQYHYTTNQLSSILEWMVGGIKAADSSAFVVAFGGMTDMGYMTNTWNLLSATTKSNISAASVHFYPPGTDWMDAESSTGQSSARTASANMGGLPIWNTESGTWGIGHRHGISAGLTFSGRYVWPHTFEEVWRRGHWQTTEKTLRTALRSLGFGAQRFFYYDGRLADYWYVRPDTNPTWYEYDDALRPDALALINLNWMIGEGSVVGPITNTVAGALVEAFLFKTGSGLSMISVWNQDRVTNRVFTVTNSTFGVFDQFGRVVVTNSLSATIRRQPTYWVSSLSTNALALAFINASVSTVADSTAPFVSVDVSPVGPNISAKELPLRFKWTAVDDVYVNTDRYANVLTRHKILGLDSDWSSWSTDRRRLVDEIPATGEYRIVVEAKDIEGVSTNSISGPLFQVGTPRATIGTARVTNLHIGQ